VRTKILTEPVPPSTGLVSPTRSVGLYAAVAVGAKVSAATEATQTATTRKAIPKR
jgi:hypothetical protein